LQWTFLSRAIILLLLRFSQKNKKKRNKMLLLTGFTLGCIAIVVLILVRDYWTLTIAKVFVALLVITGLFLLEPSIKPFLTPTWSHIAWDIMTMIPALFWLLCQLAFTDRPKFISIWSIVAIYSFTAPAFTRPFGSSNELEGLLHLFGWQLPRYMEYIIILHGMWTIIASWSIDLIENRRKLRGIVLGIVGFTAICVTFTVNTGLGSELSLPAVICFAVLICAHYLLKGGNTNFFTPILINRPSNITPSLQNTHSTDFTTQETITQKATEPGFSSVKFKVSAQCDSMMSNENSVSLMQSNKHKDLDIIKLQDLMKKGFYRTEHLTLKKLSVELGLPEYKTRALINNILGYRNFNDYVNHLRIAEAGHRLRTEIDTPILNISLDAGYRTLSSFNRAFKDILKQTPTAYRQASPSQNIVLHHNHLSE